VRRRPLFFLWLVVAWVALWGEPTPANIGSGAVIAAALVWLFPPRRGEPGGGVRPVAVVRFLVYFLGQLVAASAIVAWEVVTPRNRINEGIVAVPIEGASDTLVTIVANAISLTPGTLTLEVDRDPTVLYVHVLHLRDVDEVRRDVRRLEALADAAFGRRRSTA
jgi:multicomponent Na+:H+ antiporter subunit E